MYRGDSGTAVAIAADQAILVTGMRATGMFVAQYSADGAIQWIRWSSGSSWVFGDDLAVRPSGAVIVTGLALGEVDFGTGELASGGAFVAEYASTGAPRSSWTLGDQGASWGLAVASDSSGGFVLAGRSDGEFSLGDSAVSESGLFVARYDASGVVEWAKIVGHRYPRVGDEGSVATAPDGRVIVTGRLGSDPDSPTILGQCGGAENAIVIVASPTGDCVWYQNFTGTGGGISNDAGIDMMGNIVIAGETWGTIQLGPSDVLERPPYQRGGFIAKYSAAGDLLWARQMGGAVVDGVAVGKEGDIVVVGSFWGTEDFGGGTLTSSGDDDVFVAKYTAAGEHIWSRRFGTPEGDKGLDVAIDVEDRVVVIGSFRGDMTVGSDSLHSRYINTFVVVLDP